MGSVLRCKLCGEATVIKSNLGISEELARLQRGRCPPTKTHGCPNSACQNAHHPVETYPKRYYLHGKSASGARRYRCKLCQNTFSIKAKAAFKQKRPDINDIVFRLLVNKMPMRRICETAGIHPATLYGKIDFIHRQCVTFAHHHELILRHAPTVQRLYLALDRQDYVFNWGTQLDRRNVMLHAIGAADNETGYVFGMDLDFDPDLDSEVIEKAAIAEGDYDQQYPYRRHARLWLQRDYEDSFRLRQRIGSHRSRGRATGAAAQAHLQKLVALQAAETRGDEIQEMMDTKAPAVGMQVRAEYTMYAHFFYLRELLPGIEKIRFFLDQEPGITSACAAVFKEEIRARRVDAFLVRIRKDMTIDEKKQAKGKSEGALAKLLRERPELSRQQATLHEMRQAIDRARNAAESKVFWVQHPFPDMGEPEKAVCYATDCGDYNPDHLANLYLKASLRSIDRFFMQVRRRMSIFERPISSPSARKTWHGYSAYNPAVGAKLLTIFRVFYNFALPGQDKKTPAMRLGLMKEAATLADILEFLPLSVADEATNQTSSKRKARANSGSASATG